jgi:hypothetical protein
MWIELPRPAEPNATGHCPLATLASASADELTFKLGEAAQHRQHQPAVSCRGVGPCISEGSESGSGLGDGVEDIEKVPSRSSEAIEAGDHEDVTLLKALDDLGEFRPVADRAADLLGIDLGAAGSV